ncbi:MAG TPA: asparagine synthase [Candidatus Atribacteria bacterium]|nr:asparagine synthase [Candidatus Atribacteria bacterium]
MDEIKQKLPISRSLIDENIYYTENGKDVFITSNLDEVKNKINPSIDKKAIDLYLTLRYVPAPYTMYKGIKRVPVFHNLNVKKDEIRIQKKEMSAPKDYDYKTFVRKSRELLLDNISNKIKDESEVALLLSGGIDSSVVLAALSKFDVGIKTYTLGFSEDDSDLLHARKLAEFYSTDHKEIILGDFPEKVFQKIISNMENPNGDPTLIPVKILIENVKGVNKIFVGEGGDEVFGGYPEFRFIELGRYMKVFPTFIKSFAINFMQGEIKERGSLFLRYYNTNHAKSFLYLKSVFAPEEKEKLYTNDFKNGFEIEDGDIFNFTPDLGYLQNVMGFYLENQLPGRLIPKYYTKNFKFCFPLLDERMVDLMLLAPLEYKFSLIRGKDKKVLRKFMKPELPSFILNRKKRGFTVPIEKWMKGKLKEEINKTFNKEKIKKRKRFNWAYVQKVLRDYDKNFYWRNKLWSLFVLERWLDEHEQNR